MPSLEQGYASFMKAKKHAGRLRDRIEPMYSLTMQDFDLMEKRCMDGDTLVTIGELAKIGAFIAATASASFAGWTVRKSLIERRNTQLLAHAKLSLERAYDALFHSTPEDVAPEHDRKRWIVSARLLAEFSSAKERIEDDLTRQECEGHEDHWQLQFARRLDQLQDGPSTYFSPRREGEEIPEIAVRVIHAFASKSDGEQLQRIRQIKNETHASLISKRWSMAREYCKRH